MKPCPIPASTKAAQSPSGPDIKASLRYSSHCCAKPLAPACGKAVLWITAIQIKIPKQQCPMGIQLAPCWPLSRELAGFIRPCPRPSSQICCIPHLVVVDRSGCWACSRVKNPWAAQPFHWRKLQGLAGGNTEQRHNPSSPQQASSNVTEELWQHHRELSGVSQQRDQASVIQFGKPSANCVAGPSPSQGLCRSNPGTTQIKGSDWSKSHAFCVQSGYQQQLFCEPCGNSPEELVDPLWQWLEPAMSVHPSSQQPRHHQQAL